MDEIACNDRVFRHCFSANHYFITMNNTRSFPLIQELPKLLESSDWIWRKWAPDEDQTINNREWWIGTDSEGKNWLVKMTGGLCACREHVFSSLAQKLGISCQSSVYVLIESESSKPRLATQYSESCQLAIYLMDEHGHGPCSATCPWTNYSTSYKSGDFLRIRRASVDGVSHFEDLVRGDVLGYLCGQFEPHDHFLTSRHEYVVIDNELMFSADPGIKPSLNGCRWLKFDAALPLVTEVCRALVRLTDEELREIAEIPKGYFISNGRDLYHDLLAAKAAASEFIQ